MKVTVNKVVREFIKEGEETRIETKLVPLTFEVITSFKAHLKWEEQFQEIKGQDLTSFQTIVHAGLKNWENGKTNTAYITDALRVLYCHIDSPELPTFSEFVDLLEPENTVDIINVLSTVLIEVGKTASKN